MASYSERTVFLGVLTIVQLSKQEESEEVEVRREDQDKINRFSTLHRKEATLGEQLKLKQVGSTWSSMTSQRPLILPNQKDKEDLEEISTELELTDEDEKVP